MIDDEGLYVLTIADTILSRATGSTPPSGSSSKNSFALREKHKVKLSFSIMPFDICETGTFFFEADKIEHIEGFVRIEIVKVIAVIIEGVERRHTLRHNISVRQKRNVFFAFDADGISAHAHLSAVRFLQARDDFQKRRFTAAVRPHKPEDPPRFEHERNIFKHGFCTVPLRQIFNSQYRFHSCTDSIANSCAMCYDAQTLPHSEIPVLLLLPLHPVSLSATLAV